MGEDPANIMNRMIILLFKKNLDNKDRRRRVASVKVINTLADTFKLAYYNLLKLKKYEGLIYSKEQEIAEINQTVDLTKGIGGTGDIKQSCKSELNKIIENYTYS